MGDQEDMLSAISHVEKMKKPLKFPKRHDIGNTSTTEKRMLHALLQVQTRKMDNICGTQYINKCLHFLHCGVFLWTGQRLLLAVRLAYFHLNYKQVPHIKCKKLVEQVNCREVCTPTNPI